MTAELKADLKIDLKINFKVDLKADLEVGLKVDLKLVLKVDLKLVLKVDSTADLKLDLILRWRILNLTEGPEFRSVNPLASSCCLVVYPIKLFISTIPHVCIIRQ